MKIDHVVANNHRKAFEVHVGGRVLPYPYARLDIQVRPESRIASVFVDPELASEAFTVVLEDGTEDSVHLDAVLEYNEDPDYLRDLLLYRLTIEAQRLVDESAVSKREIIRRLGTSASQFYRLLDPTNYTKSIGQMVRLLHVLDCDVDLVVRKRRPKRRSA